VIWNAAFLVSFLVALFSSYKVGYIRGHRDGLHAPLTERQAALSADLRRATNNLGAATPVVRRARYIRYRRRDKLK
jgi:hypothetical protein